ncbi:MAG: hypothetical protein WC748_05595 [Legionellales bacterium]|jgi:hypothetical protein
MTHEELFEKSQSELDVKIAQHKMGITFSVHQMQSIRVAMANMNFAASQLGGEYLSIADNYNIEVKDIEVANQNNSDKRNYLHEQNSPQRYGKKKPAPPPLFTPQLAIVKASSSSSTKKLALYALKMNSLAAQVENMSISTQNPEQLAAQLDSMKLQ